MKARRRVKARREARAGKTARAMRVRLGAALVAIAVFSVSHSRAEERLACEREMTRAAAVSGVPLNVLYSVGLTETGRKGELSPYDMNIDGKDVHSLSLAEAMAAFARAKAQRRKAHRHRLHADQSSLAWRRLCVLERDVRSGAQCRIRRPFPEESAGRGGQLDAGGRALQCRTRQSGGGASLRLRRHPQHDRERLWPLDGECERALPVAQSSFLRAVIGHLSRSNPGERWEPYDTWIAASLRSSR